jgi:hypothetical protein
VSDILRTFVLGLAAAVVAALMANILASDTSVIEDKPILLVATHQGETIGGRWTLGVFSFFTGAQSAGPRSYYGSTDDSRSQDVAAIGPKRKI